MNLQFLFIILAFVSCLLMSPAEVRLARSPQKDKDEILKRIVVKIDTPDETGAGIVVNVKDNIAFVLTAYHIVKDATEISVTFFDKREAEFKKAKVFKFYSDLDIAVIKVENEQGKFIPDDLPTINVGAVPKNGDNLSVIGHPADLEWQFNKRAYTYTRLGYQNDFRKFLYMNPSLQRGESGGPVFDESDNLIGVVSGRGPSGNAIAVTIDAALSILNQDWGISTPKLLDASMRRDPNFVVEVYEQSRTKPLKGAFVTLKDLISDSKQQRQTEDSGLARFKVEDNRLWQLSLMIKRGDKWNTAVLSVDQNINLPYARSIDISEIKSEEWAAVETISIADPLQRFLKFADYGFETKTDLLNLNWPLSISGDLRLASRHLPWGIPKADKIIYRSGYILGYDSKKRIPRWTAYRMSLSDIYIRRAEFSRDPSIPPNEQAEFEDYKGSGYERGHLVSPEDVAGYGTAAIVEANYLSTVAPQTSTLNRRAWSAIEKYARNLARFKYDRVWIIAGPAFISQPGGIINYPVIGQNKVAVPSAFFRIIIKQESNSALKITAFLVKNSAPTKVGRWRFFRDLDETLKNSVAEANAEDITRYTTSIDEIEQITGLDFFSTLDSSKQQEIESQKTSLLN
jgi:endonuclease G, mitochondrial